MSNQVYYTKSMNGINSFDDGSGTVIEDGSVTTTALNITSFNAQSLTSGTIVTNTISAIDATVTHNLEVINDIHSGFLRVDNTITGGFISLNDQFGAFYGQTLDTNISGGYVNLYNSTDNLELNFGGNTDTLNIGSSNTGVITILNDNTNNINIGGYGPIKLGNVMKIIASQLLTNGVNDTISLFNNITGGGINMFTGLTNGTCRICTALTTGNIQIGNPSAPSLIKIGNFLQINGYELTGGVANSTIGLFPAQIGGEIQMGSGLTTGVVLVGHNMTTGYVRIGPYFRFTSNTLETEVDGTTYTLFNNMVTSNLRIGHSMTSGTFAIGNNKTSGEMNIMNNNPGTQNLNIMDNGNGTINMIRNSTTTANVNIANTWKIWKNNFEFFNLSTTFNFLNNLTSTVTMNMGGFGTLNIGTITTNLITIGGSGVVAIGSILKVGTAQIWGYTKFGTSATAFTIPSNININYFFVATGTLVGQVITLPSYIDGQIIRIRNNKLSASCVIQCFGTQSLTLKNNGTATNLSVGSNTTTMLIGTATTWFHYI